MNTRLSPFQFSTPCSDPTGMWGLQKLINGDLGTLTDVVSIVVYELDGETVFDGVTCEDVQANTEAVTIAGVEFGIGQALLFTKVAEANLTPQNLKAIAYYQTTEGLYETSVHDIVLGPIPSR